MQLSVGRGSEIDYVYWALWGFGGPSQEYHILGLAVLLGLVLEVLDARARFLDQHNGGDRLWGDKWPRVHDGDWKLSLQLSVFWFLMRLYRALRGRSRQFVQARTRTRCTARGLKLQ